MTYIDLQVMFGYFLVFVMNQIMSGTFDLKVPFKAIIHNHSKNEFLKVWKYLLRLCSICGAA